MSCLLTQNLIISDCKAIPQGGLTGRIWLGNFTTFKESTLTLGSDGEITAIAPESGETLLYRIEVPNRGALSVETPFQANEDGVSGVQHVVNLLISDLSMAMKNSLATLLNFNKVIAIVETDDYNIGGDGDTAKPAYVLFGISKGLVATNFNNQLNDASKGGAIQLTLTTPIGVELNQATNVDMTKAEIEALESVAGD